MEDDRKLCEYSLPGGASISALFEPDVNIDIEVSTGHQTQKLTVSNATTIMALKAQICEVFKCSISPGKLEMRLEDVTLEDPMPLHFYGIENGFELEAMTPYVNVMVETNHGTEIYWRLYRKDTIREVKEELATSFIKRGPHPNESVRIEQFHLYLVTDGQNFDELDDDKTVENCKIKEDDSLFLLSYMWTKKVKVTVKQTGRALRGCEKDDTCLAVKVKAHHQTGTPLSTIRLVRLAGYEWKEYSKGYTFSRSYQQLTGISDEELPFNYKQPLSIVTQEDRKADVARVEEEKKTWLEGLRRKGYLSK